MALKRGLRRVHHSDPAVPTHPSKEVFITGPLSFTFGMVEGRLPSPPPLPSVHTLFKYAVPAISASPRSPGQYFSITQCYFWAHDTVWGPLLKMYHPTDTGRSTPGLNPIGGFRGASGAAAAPPPLLGESERTFFCLIPTKFSFKKFICETRWLKFEEFWVSTPPTP